jgi:NADPH2:quinone reductase
MAWGVQSYGPVETLGLIEMAIPDPGLGELMIDVEAVALNPLDLKIISGQMDKMMPARMPFAPGSDVVGTVTAAGDGAPARVGDRIVASTWSGGLAHRALLPTTAHIVVVSGDAPATELAALPMAGLTALNILRGLGDVSGKQVAVLGATGGVGLALVQYASKQGARLIASATDTDTALVMANGADETIDYRQTPFIEALRHRHPEGVDMLVDLVSMFDALLASANAVRDRGVLLSTLFGPDPAAFGNRIKVVYSRLKAEPGDLEAVVHDYLAHRFRANVGATFPFDQGREACLALRDRHVTGKIVVSVS